MNSTFLSVAGLCLSGLLIRTCYERLKRAGKINTKNPAIFTAVFIGMCILLASWPIMCPRDPWHIAFPNFVKWIGLATAAIACALAVGGLCQLRGLENIDHLITTGLYSRLRHPMYAGFILWIIGWVVSWGAIASLLVGLVCIANILYWRFLEERSLESHYGEKYRAYRRATWF